jgi:hypothetical protein
MIKKGRDTGNEYWEEDEEEETLDLVEAMTLLNQPENGVTYDETYGLE